MENSSGKMLTVEEVDRIAGRVAEMVIGHMEKDRESLLQGQAELLGKASVSPREVSAYQLEGKLCKRQVINRCKDGYYGLYARKDEKGRWTISTRYFIQKRAVQRKRALMKVL